MAPQVNVDQRDHREKVAHQAVEESDRPDHKVLRDHRDHRAEMDSQAHPGHREPQGPQAKKVFARNTAPTMEAFSLKMELDVFALERK